ncbi:MAG: hypothetical protein SFX18_07515 [Pirellulales bacterium]|nr:hypothetical protein [Pirellulales bacterium]
MSGIFSSLDSYPVDRQSSKSCSSALRGWVAAWGLLLLACAGCDEELEVRYGRAYGPSVNGTSVLQQMFRDAGHTVNTRSQLTPELQRNGEVLVWFPDNFNLPDDKVRDWLDNWLTAQPNRMLIYIHRDFDAEPLYWQEVQSRNLSKQTVEVAQRLGEAENRFLQERNGNFIYSNRNWSGYGRPGIKDAISKSDFPWLQIAELPQSHSPGPVKSVSGPWSVGLDQTKLALRQNSQLVLPTAAVELTPLLRADGLDFAFLERIPRGNFSLGRNSQDSWRLCVNNGSFLLNYPLINPQHRQLALQLINQVGSARRVDFLESDWNGPRIRDTNTIDQRPNGWEFFTIQPLGMILGHLAWIGIMFCFIRWPIFGRPRPLPRVSAFDFGLHLQALANLLARTRQPQFAREKIAQYRHQAGIVEIPGEIPTPDAPRGQVVDTTIKFPSS